MTNSNAPSCFRDGTTNREKGNGRAAELNWSCTTNPTGSKCTLSTRDKWLAAARVYDESNRQNVLMTRSKEYYPGNINS